MAVHWATHQFRITGSVCIRAFSRHCNPPGVSPPHAVNAMTPELVEKGSAFCLLTLCANSTDTKMFGFILPHDQQCEGEYSPPCKQMR
jgi:hypothetical protein